MFIARCLGMKALSLIEGRCCRQQRDPIEHVRKLLLDNGFADASELKKLEKVRHAPKQATKAAVTTCHSVSFSCRVA